MAVMEQWSVISEPISDNYAADNNSGMSVSLVCGDRKEELGSIAWDRKKSANPKKSMGDVLREKVQEAQKAADELNKLEVAKMEKAKEAFEPVRAQLQAELAAAGGLLQKLAGLDFAEIERNRDALEAISKVDFASVEAARQKLEPLREQLQTEFNTVRDALDAVRTVDLFRLDKARQMVEDLRGLELVELEDRQKAVEPIAKRLEAEREAAQAAIDEYDVQVADKIASLKVKAGSEPL
jgi:hypothetical protein